MTLILLELTLLSCQSYFFSCPSSLVLAFFGSTRSTLLVVELQPADVVVPPLYWKKAVCFPEPLAERQGSQL